MHPASPHLPTAPRAGTYFNRHRPLLHGVGVAGVQTSKGGVPIVLGGGPPGPMILSVKRILLIVMYHEIEKYLVSILHVS